MLPAPYGPLWIALSQVVLGAFPALLGKLIVLRVLGALALAAIIAGLRALGMPIRILALVALNPALALQYVCDAHNDLLAMAIVVGAAVAVRRLKSAALAAAMLAVAGTMKLPFVVLGLPVLAAVRSRPMRYAAIALAVVLAAGISWIACGPAYFAALRVHVPSIDAVYFANAVVSVVALAAIAIAALGGPRRRGAVWVIPMMGSYVATWYMAYGLPYALERRRMLAALLIALPWACALIDVKFACWWSVGIVLPATVAACLFFGKRA
jgi:hypothetical protein